MCGFQGSNNNKSNFTQIFFNLRIQRKRYSYPSLTFDSKSYQTDIIFCSSIHFLLHKGKRIYFFDIIDSQNKYTQFNSISIHFFCFVSETFINVWMFAFFLLFGLLSKWMNQLYIQWNNDRIECRIESMFCYFYVDFNETTKKKIINIWYNDDNVHFDQVKNMNIKNINGIWCILKDILFLISKKKGNANEYKELFFFLNLMIIIISI